MSQEIAFPEITFRMENQEYQRMKYRNDGPIRPINSRIAITRYSVSPPDSIHQNPNPFPEPRQDIRDDGQRGYEAGRSGYSRHGGPGGRMGRS